MTSSSNSSEFSVIQNHVTVGSSNAFSNESTCSTILIKPQPIYLVFTQYVITVGNNLIYYIYVINNLKCSIRNIKLKDILPKRVKFISTFVENGEYKYCNDEIFYSIDNIKSHSFCKITIILQPITLGEKTNSIEVMCKKSKCIVNNPCKLSCTLGLKLECHN